MPTFVVRYPASALGGAVGVLGWVYLVATGVGTAEALALTTVVGIQAVAGGMAWTLLRGERADPVERVGMALAVGTAASTVLALAVTSLIGWTYGWLIPIAVVLPFWLRQSRTASPVRAREPFDRGITVGLLTLLVVGLVSLIPNLVSYPLTWAGVWGRYHADMLFFEALSTSLARLGGFESIFTPDAQIRYHWLVYAWSGQVSQAADAPPFVTLVRVVPLLAVMGTGLLAIAWVRRLTSVAWAPALTVLLLVSGGYLGATYGAIFNFDSPSQSFTMLWLLAFLLTLMIGIQDRSRSATRGALAAASALFMFSLAGGKISAGGVAIVAVGWLGIVALVRRPPWWKNAVAFSFIALGAFAASYVIIVSGSADPGGLQLFDLLDRGSSVQGLNPIAGGPGIILGTMMLAVAIAVRWAGLSWLVANRETRWSADAQIGVGLTLAALVTIVALSGGLNDTWFALAASAPLSVLSAAGAAEAWASLRSRRWLVIVIAALIAVGAFILVTALWMTGASGGTEFVFTWRWAGPLVGLITAGVASGLAVMWISGRSPRSFLVGLVLGLVFVSVPGRLLGVGTGLVGVQPGLSSDTFSPIVRFTKALDWEGVSEWSDDQVAAAAWIRANTPLNALLATNVTFSPLVPALTARQTLASGILYQAPYGRPGVLAPLLEREKRSWAFVDSPNEMTLKPLCDAQVDTVWVDPQRTGTRDWEPFAMVEFEAEDVILLRISPEACEGTTD